MSIIISDRREPEGEIVSLDFYFGRLSSADAIEGVTKQCLASGGTYCGVVYVTEYEGARASPFESVYSDSVSRLQLSADQLFRDLRDEDKRVVRIPIGNAIGVGGEIADVVTFNSVSRAASTRDSHPVSIAAEGWVFSTPGFEKRSIKVGARCRSRFLGVCQALDPDYAAILNENSLPCAHDLKDVRNCRCFCDFFVSAAVYGGRLVSEIEGMYKDAYVERVGKGIFVSVSAVYNPRNRKIDRRDALSRSNVVANMLSSK